jgi:hypothetical protein
MLITTNFGARIIINDQYCQSNETHSNSINNINYKEYKLIILILYDDGDGEVDGGFVIITQKQSLKIIENEYQHKTMELKPSSSSSTKDSEVTS